MDLRPDMVKDSQRLTFSDSGVHTALGEPLEGHYYNGEYNWADALT